MNTITTRERQEGTMSNAPPRPTPELTLPIIHNNGSGRQNLLDERAELCHALWKASEALSQMRPNIRDYYVSPEADKLWIRAQDQHTRRARIIHQLYTEIQEEMEALCQ